VNLDRKYRKRAKTTIIQSETKHNIRNPKFLKRFVEPYSSDCFSGVVLGLNFSEMSTIKGRILSIGISFPNLKLPNSSINDKTKRVFAGISMSKSYTWIIICRVFIKPHNKERDAAIKIYKAIFPYIESVIVFATTFPIFSILTTVAKYI